MRLHGFTEQGVCAFRDYLARLRDQPLLPPPRHLLDEPAHARPIGGAGELPAIAPGTRLELASSLQPLLQPLDGQAAPLEQNVALWSWLSLCLFDLVCPPGPGGERRPGPDYLHVLDTAARRADAHLLAGAYLVYQLHGPRAELLLCSPVHVANRFFRELASRQALVTNPQVIEAARRLYFDEERRRPRRGPHGRKTEPGTLRRFVALLQQLDLNYDLYSLDADELLALLPAEFDAWKGGSQQVDPSTT